MATPTSTPVPRHIAIIMDGNGRWASERKRPRIWGHTRGASVVASIVEEATHSGVSVLTLYAFSTENWSRPSQEISVLFKLMKKFLQRERNRLIANNVRFKVMGHISHLPLETQNLIKKLEEDTKDMTALLLNFAFDYSGRSEILYAVNNLLHQKKTSCTESDLTNNFFVPEAGDVDLLIRTGGDKRISNFLIWQAAYAELYFTNVMWPDFSREYFKLIIHDYMKRERRFGSVLPSSDLNDVSSKASAQKKSWPHLSEEELRSN